MTITTRDIIAYQWTQRDDSIENPYLNDVCAVIEGLRASGAADIAGELLRHRPSLVERYAFSIPTADILDLIRRHSPILEVGAGSGYWARCLEGAGADVLAVDRTVPGEGMPWDPFSNNAWFDDTWFDVVEGDESAAALHPGRSLFLCWPPFNVPMASHSLELHRRAGGKTMLYIGNPASSGDAAFHEACGKLGSPEIHPLWSWPGTGEALYIYSLQ